MKYCIKGIKTKPLITLQKGSYINKTVKTYEGVLCSVIEHGMTPLSFQTATQKNEAKLSSFVQFEKEMASYRVL